MYDIMKQITLATRLHVTSHDKLTDAAQASMQARRTDSACLSPRTIRARKKGDHHARPRTHRFPNHLQRRLRAQRIRQRHPRGQGRRLRRAEKLIEEGETDFLAGHKAHQQLLTDEAAGTAAPVTLLLAHAEDQLMSAEAFKILAREFIDLYQRVEEKAPR